MDTASQRQPATHPDTAAKELVNRSLRRKVGTRSACQPVTARTRLSPLGKK
jgi:hypothetical protein